MAPISLKRFFPFFIFLILSSLLISCAKEKVKLSEDGLRVRSIEETIGKIKKGYLREKAVEVLDYVSPEGSLEEFDLKGALDELFTQLTPITLNFFLEKVILRGDAATAFLHWEGKWEDKNMGTAFSKKGDVIFVLVGEEDPRLLEIQGDSPFHLRGFEKP